MKRFLCQIIAVVFVIPSILAIFLYTEAAIGAEKAITLIAANWTPTKMPPPIDWEPFDFVFNEWMDTIEYQTKGKVKFKRYPAETLVKVTDYWEAVKGGICDVGIVCLPMFPGQFPMTAALRLPGLFDNSIQGSVVRQMLFEEGYLAPEWAGVKFLWIGISPYHFNSSQKFC